MGCGCPGWMATGVGWVGVAGGWSASVSAVGNESGFNESYLNDTATCFIIILE